MELLDEAPLRRKIIWHSNKSFDIDDDEYMYFRPELPDHRCSINQSKLAGWTWLIGSTGGVLKPLLCDARSRDTCESAGPRHLMADTEAVYAVNSLVALANLVTLAVWCRCKSTTTRPEVAIQLLLLRLFSIVGIVGSVFSTLPPWWPTEGGAKTFSIPHAALLAHFANFAWGFTHLSYNLSVTFALLASIYLVEHSHVSQSVLLFVSLRRAHILTVAAMLTCLAMSAPLFVMCGFVYCENGSAAHLMSRPYFRTSDVFFHIHDVVHNFVIIILFVVTIILLIIYTSKQCCACCRCGGSDDTPESVAYVKQVDEGADPVQPVVIELGSSLTQGCNRAEEFRKLIFWQQVLTICLIVALSVILILIDTITKKNHVIIRKFFVTRVVPFSSHAVLSPIFSPTFRSGVASMAAELKSFVTGFRQCVRRW